MFADVTPKIVTAWRGRAAVESPSHLRDHPTDVALTLLSALLYCREREITDTLVDLLCSTVHRIGARAEVRVTNQLIKEFKRVTGKENLLFRLAEATVDAGDKLVRDAVYPVVSRTVLADLVAEFKSSGPTYQRTVKATLKASYTNHYRAGMIKLLSVLEFCSNNTTHRPVLDALQLIARYANAGNLRYYPAGETVSVHRGIAGEWEALVYANDAHHRQRVVRMVYEVCTFQALREQLRCKEIWVVGADRWRNPAEDLPTYFERRRVEHYAALRKPLDPTEFVDELREEMRAELDALHAALPRYDWLTISDRASGPITLTPLAAAPEPRNLRRLKQAVHTHWGVVPLIDMLKEAVLRTGCLRGVTSVAGRRALPDFADGPTTRQVWLAAHQLIDSGGQGVGIVKVLIIERQVGRVGQAAGGSHQLDVQALGVLVGPLGALPVLAVLLAQLLDVGPREGVRLLGLLLLLVVGHLGHLSHVLGGRVVWLDVGCGVAPALLFLSSCRVNPVD